MPANSAASAAASATRYVPIHPDRFDKANDAVTRASALLNVVSASYDSELGSFVPRDLDVWLTVLTALRLVDDAAEALGVSALVKMVEEEVAARASGPA